MKKVLNIDWLSLFCDLSKCHANESFSLEDTNNRSLSFDKIFKVKMGNRDVAELQAVPHSKFIDAHCGILKINNELLYSPNLADWLTALFFNTEIHPLSISRIDLCCDFQIFDNGLKPIELIRQFLNDEIIKVGKTTYYMRGEDFENGHIQWRSAHGTFCVKNDFELMGDGANTGDRFSYLAFGARTSDVRTYLYNKSKELREVKDKPYIRQTWRQAGASPADVWRLEFSTKGSRFKVISKETGEMITNSIRDIITSQTQDAMFSALYSRYFDFRTNTKKVRRDQETRLMLFDGDYTHYHLQRYTKAKDNLRADKVFLKKLDKCANECYSSDLEIEENAIRTGQLYSECKGLTRWCLANGIDFSEKRLESIRCKKAELIVNE